MRVTENFRTFCRPMARYRYSPKILSAGRFVLRHPFIGGFLHVLLILATLSLDSLFFYIPVINTDLNCLGLDNILRVIVVVLRTFVDGGYITLWLLDFLFEKRHHRVLSWIAVILAILPLPQVVTYAVSWSLLTVKLLKFMVLIQFVPRVYLTIPTFNYARNRFRGKIKVWFAATFYLFMFVIVSNVLGAFYYLRAIERNIDCWRKACKIRGLCGISSLYCHGSSTDNRYLDEFCPTPPSPNSTFFDYGIYLDAFQRDIMSTHTNFLNKFFYCLWWGLQSLSSLGQNLHPGTYIWDNLFAIFIVISGLVLLASLIGNMQVYLQQETNSEIDLEKQERERKEERTQRVALMNKGLKCWYPFYELPRPLRSAICECDDEDWLRTTKINLESFLNNAPPELRKDTRLHLCKDLFSKVPEFVQLPTVIQMELRERAKAAVFEARDIIRQEGHPVYEMIHIVEGKALVFSRDRNIKEEFHAYNLKRNDFIGKELLDNALESSEPNLPLATGTVQALTKVEAFTLSFDDFVTVFTKHGNLLPSYQTIWAKTKIKWALMARGHYLNRLDPEKQA